MSPWVRRVELAFVSILAIAVIVGSVVVLFRDPVATQPCVGDMHTDQNCYR